jgi:hypothetical protein
MKILFARYLDPNQLYVSATVLQTKSQTSSIITIPANSPELVLWVEEGNTITPYYPVIPTYITSSSEKITYMLGVYGVTLDELREALLTSSSEAH